MHNCVEPDVGQDGGRVGESPWTGGGQFIENLFPNWRKLGTREGLVHT